MQPSARPSRRSGTNIPERQPIAVASSRVRGNSSKTASASATTTTRAASTQLARHARAVERPPGDAIMPSVPVARDGDPLEHVARGQRIFTADRRRDLAAGDDCVEDWLRIGDRGADTRRIAAVAVCRSSACWVSSNRRAFSSAMPNLGGGVAESGALRFFRRRSLARSSRGRRAEQAVAAEDGHEDTESDGSGPGMSRRPAAARAAFVFQPTWLAGALSRAGAGPDTRQRLDPQSPAVLYSRGVDQAAVGVEPANADVAGAQHLAQLVADDGRRCPGSRAPRPRPAGCRG